jgi:ribosome-associated protein YbcJ (S4-like RNA binding protein)
MREKAAEQEAQMMYEERAMAKSSSAYPLAAPVPAPANVTSVQTAAGGSAMGDQFAYTVKNPVTLNRRQSAMIPLVNGTMGAVKTLVLTGSKALGGSIHPDLAVELTNTTGMKLPAGPITVFDGGSYAGDALIEFFGENDKRLIKYGEDLSVSGMAAYSAGTRTVSSITITGGVMTINRRQIHERTYTVKNTGGEAKRLIIEHPIMGNSTLTEPKSYLEKTDSLYRFAQNLPANGEITLKVQEESPIAERITLGQLRPESLVSYSTSQEIPSNVRAALAKAVDLRQKNDAARQTQNELETRRRNLISEQDRVRQNLNAVGSGSDLGREYMKRMTALDNDIDGLNKEIEQAAALVRSTQKDFDDYIAGLKL